MPSPPRPRAPTAARPHGAAARVSGGAVVAESRTGGPAAEAPAARAPARRLSEALRRIGDGGGDGGDRVSVGDIVDALGDRSFPPLMAIFAAPNVFLFIPGSAVFTSLPMVFLAVQLMAGRGAVWLPRFVAARSIERKAFRRIVAAALPHVERIERLARPCRWPASGLLAERTVGAATLVLALLLFVPIPFAGCLPALSAVMLALALGERDGRWLAAGLALGLLSIVVVAAMVSASALAAMRLLSG